MNELEYISYQLAREFLNPPIQLFAVATPGFSLPNESEYSETFDSIDAAYVFFRQEKPKRRWILWLKGADGQIIGVDSRICESS